MVPLDFQVFHIPTQNDFQKLPFFSWQHLDLTTAEALMFPTRYYSTQSCSVGARCAVALVGDRSPCRSVSNVVTLEHQAGGSDHQHHLFHDQASECLSNINYQLFCQIVGVFSSQTIRISFACKVLTKLVYETTVLLYTTLLHNVMSHQVYNCLDI